MGSTFYAFLPDDGVFITHDHGLDFEINFLRENPNGQKGVLGFLTPIMGFITGFPK